jgi:phenylalanyl-tRNA synthetase alpha chain
MRLLATGHAVRIARRARFARVQPAANLRRAWSNAALEQSAPQPGPPESSSSIGSSYEKTRNDPWPSAKVGSGSAVPAPPQNSSPFRTPFEQYLIDEKKPNTVLNHEGSSGLLISSHPHTFDAISNLSTSIIGHLDRRLYMQQNHPICITRKLVESVFAPPTYENHVASNPVVTAADNFDGLGFPADHPGRSRTDTYYVNEKHVLRTHTSAHQLHAFSRLATKPSNTGQNQQPGYSGYTICADVFRRDSIDRSHFPVFHQMEGAHVWGYQPSRTRTDSRYELFKRRKNQIAKDLHELPSHGLKVEDPNQPYHANNPAQAKHDHEEVRLMARHLKKSLEILVAKVLTQARDAGGNMVGTSQEPLQVRWIDAFFPFTSPSWELEVFWQGEWLELLGCGIVKQELLEKAGCGDKIGWAWGIGIERLAMLLFGIPDIRLFWSQDERFLSQFKEGRISKYEPFSKYPECYKDVAFWISAAPAATTPVAETELRGGVASAAGGDARKASPAEIQPAAFHENDVMEIVRDTAGSLAEDVKLVDEFVHPTSGRKSLCYRIVYRSLERTLTNEEVNKVHGEVVARLARELDVDLR